MYKIRDMEFDDIDEVVSIEKENFSLPWDANGFFSFMIREGSVFVCAEDDGRIAGYGGMLAAADQADITNISVRVQERRLGVGTEILNELCRRAEALGVDTVFLEVRKSNEAAIGLYERTGFTKEGVRRDYYEAPKEDALVMKKELHGRGRDVIR